MVQQSQDIDGFLAAVRLMAGGPPNHKRIGNARILARLAGRFGLSAETARGLLRKEGWLLYPTSSGTLQEWRPPGR